MKKSKRLLTAIGAAAGLMITLALAACGGSDASSDETAVQIVSVTRGNLTTTVSAVGSISMPQQADLTFGGGSTTDIFTVSEVNVKEGDNVRKGDVLARIKADSLERAVRQAEADLRTAQINLAQASSETNILKARAAVESARANLAKAEKELADARAPYSDLDIAEAEAAVESAQIALESAQSALTITRKNADYSIKQAQYAAEDAFQAYSDYVGENIERLTEATITAEKDRLWEAYQAALNDVEEARLNAATSIATAENNVTKAQNTLTSARKALADLVPDSLTIQQKEAAVASAKATLAQAEDDLAYAEAGHNIELLQLKVDSARVALDEARDQLEAATIVAPFDGTVAEVNAAPGDEVTPNTIIIRLVDTSTVEVDAAVDEVDVALIKPGQTAIITLDALPNTLLRGEVTFVAILASSQSGVVTYDIAIKVLNPEGAGLRQGMSATIEIVSVQAENALLVPSKAITRKGPTQIVEVVTADGSTEERTVETGETNGTFTEIKSGLAEGEKVRVQVSSSTSTRAASEVQVFPGGGGFMIPEGGRGMRPPM